MAIAVTTGANDNMTIAITSGANGDETMTIAVTTEANNDETMAIAITAGNKKKHTAPKKEAVCTQKSSNGVRFPMWKIIIKDVIAFHIATLWLCLYEQSLSMPTETKFHKITLPP